MVEGINMRQEDKELLLKDLCARLPYGVKINTIQGDFTLLGLTNERAFTTCEVEGCHNDFPIDCIKPYLFPLSSMTEEQKMFLKQQNWCIAISTSGTVETTIEGFDWLNKNHLDYRCLIEKGLAIDATGLNIYC